jgi:autotransporter-associated beta strand protein
MNTGGTNNFLVNSLNSPAGDGKTLKIANNAGVGNGNTTINVTSTTGDTLEFGSSFGVSANGSSAFGGPITTFNLTNANVILNGMSADDGQMAVSSTTGNSLTINGNVSSSSSRTIGATVNSGILTLNDTFTGGTSGSNWGFWVTLNGGTLNLNNNNALNNNDFAAHGNNGFVIAGGTLDNTSVSAVTLNGHGTTMGIGFNGDFTYGGTNNLDLGNNATTLNGAAGARTITTNGTGTLTLSGAIANGTATGITKAGSGTLKLSGTSTYTGATNINAGNLIVSGSLAGSGAVNVNNGGTLGAGSGTITGVTTVASGGTLYPGVTTSGSHTLALNNNVVFQANSTYKINVLGAGSSDKLTIAGSLTLGANDTLTLNLLSALSGTYTIATFNSGGVLGAGAFANVDSQIAANGYQVVYNDTSIQLVAIPEPGTWAMLIGGVGMLVLFRRRRRA